MSRKHFGTDGVRGVANEKLTPELAFQLGQAAGRLLAETGGEPRVVMGRDTRKSGSMLGAALAAGLCSVGIDVVSLGVAPTPTVSFIARTGAFGLGAIISASHNPAPDNGIKFVGHDGRKLTDALEARIEALIDLPLEGRPVGAYVGEITFQYDFEAYLEHLRLIVPEGLAGLKVAVDAAHGAAYALGPEILRRLGAEVECIGIQPDGVNINATGGATKPEVVQAFTTQINASVGVAFDGDADRAVFSDGQGRLINGDRMMGIWAAYYQDCHQLHPPIVVGTVMSNGGFEEYLTSRGITLERTQVGDKYVSQRIEEQSARIGGEQSGHIVLPERGPTGDGLATMLEFLRVLRLSGKPASAWYDDYQAKPQVLINVSVADRESWRTDEVDRTILAEEAKLGKRGRINVRASGTQPVVRIMVEADNYPTRDAAAETIVDVLSRESGAKVKGRTDLTNGLGD